jgi:NTP pyrophosphatase (non-canonical NTP hydrolase)
MNDKITTIEDLKKIKRSFVEERNWEQFHTPKNITMALAVEAAELMELFIWSDTQESIQELEKKREEVEHEVADVLAYLLSLCSRYDIDLTQAFEKKMKLNAEKYPIEKSKGRSTKYSNL